MDNEKEYQMLVKYGFTLSELIIKEGYWKNIGDKEKEAVFFFLNLNYKLKNSLD